GVCALPVTGRGRCEPDLRPVLRSPAERCEAERRPAEGRRYGNWVLARRRTLPGRRDQGAGAAGTPVKGDLTERLPGVVPELRRNETAGPGLPALRTLQGQSGTRTGVVRISSFSRLACGQKSHDHHRR